MGDRIPCSNCDGPSVLSSWNDGKCSDCHGTGKEAIPYGDIFGSKCDCPSCGGSGKCPTCYGKGYLDT